MMRLRLVTRPSMRLFIVLLLLIESRSEGLQRRRLDVLKDFFFFTADHHSDSTVATADVIYVPMWPVDATTGKGKGGSRGTKGSKGKGKGNWILPPPPPPGKGFLPPPPGKGSSKLPLPIPPPKEDCPPVSPPFPVPTPAPVPAPTLRNPAGQPVFIIPQPSANIVTPAPSPVDTRVPSGGLTTEPTITNNTPTAGQITTTVFNSFIIGNRAGLTASDLVTSGSEPGASNAVALDEGYAAYIAAEVDDYASSLSRRILRRNGRDLTSKRTVTLVDGSPTIYQLGDVACPSYYLGDCQVVCANFDVLSTGFDESTLEADLMIQTQKDILNLNEEMRSVDPTVLIEVLRASFPVQPCVAAPATASPSPVSMPVTSPVLTPAAAPSRAPLPSGMTNAPTGPITDSPSAGPTSQPTDRPSASPSQSSSTSATPTIQPTERPSFAPSSSTAAPTTFTGAPTPFTLAPTSGLPSSTSVPTISAPTSSTSSPTTLTPIPSVATGEPTSVTRSPALLPSFNPVSANPAATVVPTNTDTLPQPTRASIDTQVPSVGRPSTSLTTEPSVSSAPSGPTASPAPSLLGTTSPTATLQPSTPSLDSNAPNSVALPTSSLEPTSVPVPTTSTSPSAAIETELPTVSSRPTSTPVPTATPTITSRPSISAQPSNEASITTASLRSDSSDEMTTPVKFGIGLAGAAGIGLLMVAAGLSFTRKRGRGDKLDDVRSIGTEDHSSSQDMTSSFEDGDEDASPSDASSVEKSSLEQRIMGRGLSLSALLKDSAELKARNLDESPFLRDDAARSESEMSVFASLCSYASESASLLQDIQSENDR